MIDLTFPLRAPRGSDLNTKGWLQEAALRCLLNNLDPEVAEDPELAERMLALDHVDPGEHGESEGKKEGGQAEFHRGQIRRMRGRVRLQQPRRGR